MNVLAPASLWPPRAGDYARVWHGGALGEVIDIARKGDDCRYTLNVFAQDTDEAHVYRLDDLEPVWHGQSERGAGQTWDDAPSPFWSTSWPSWTR